MYSQSGSRRDEKTGRLARACREHGIPLTHQRRAVLEAIADRGDHPTAERIYGEVCRNLSSVSRMTVYRVLDLLVDLGIITKVSHPGNTVRFDPIMERHHHLVCLRCDQLFDFQDSDLDDLEFPDTRRLGFRVADYSIQFTGICSACEQRKPGRRPGPRGRT